MRSSHVDGIRQGENPQLLAIYTDNSDFPGTDFPINPGD